MMQMETIDMIGSSPAINELKAEVNTLKQLVEQQRKALEQIQAKQTTVEATVSALPVANKKPETSPLIIAGWDKNRPVLRSADGNLEAAFGGFAHFDFRGYSEGTHPANTFLIRRARLFVDGKLAKWFKESTLLEQPFVKDPERTIKDLVNGVSAKTGEKVSIARFARFKIGGA